MLHHVSKIMLPFLIVSVSCNQKKQTFEALKPELLIVRTEIFNYSKNLVGDSLYWQVYNQMKDSVNVWSHNDLGLWRHLKDTNINWSIDSVLCFNMGKNKVVTMILRQEAIKGAVSDSEEYFLGAKVGDQWCFFDMGSVALFRKYYQKDISQPLSLATLGLLATRYVYAGYLKRKWYFWGDYEVNDNFFKEFYNKNEHGEATTGYGGCRHCKTQDEYYLYRVAKNWSERSK